MITETGQCELLRHPQTGAQDPGMQLTGVAGGVADDRGRTALLRPRQGLLGHATGQQFALQARLFQADDPQRAAGMERIHRQQHPTMAYLAQMDAQQVRAAAVIQHHPGMRAGARQIGQNGGQAALREEVLEGRRHRRGDHAAIEALVAARQALGLPQPGPAFEPPQPLRLAADVRVPGGEVMVGTPPESGFAFDNEQDAHPVRIPPFDISMQPVTNTEFLQFVEDGGYHRARLWSPPAFAQITSTGRVAPSHWRRVGQRWQMRWFDRWVPLEPYAPVVHVDAFEAEAWCTWAGRRLPSETEWEHAASSLDGFEWGDTVWEWTASPFVPYAGFRAGPYADYSEPWFGTHRVVRGGSFATPPGLLDARMRNFYRPERGDVFVGFRSCAPR